MVWVEILLKFIVDIVHYAAWPVVVIGVIYLFREPLDLKIRALIAVGHKGTSLEFDMPDKVRKIVESPADVFAVTGENLNYENFLNFMESLAVVVGILALELQKYNNKSEYLPLAKHILKMTTTKIKADRSDSKLLQYYSQFEEQIQPQTQDK